MSARSLQLNPLLKAATVEQIKAKRNELEQAPITVSGVGTFDADDKSLVRMKAALDNWATLPTVVSGEITWVLADNSSVVLDETAFAAAVNAIGVAWAERSATVHIVAQTLPGTFVTVGDLDDSATWEI